MAQHKGATTMSGDTQSDTLQLDPSKPPDAYGQPIRAERQAKLQGYLDRWAGETDHGERKGPFDKESGQDTRVYLTGADVSWLAEQSGRDEIGQVPNLHLEGAILYEAHLEGASLGGAHLEGANLGGAHLEGAFLYEAHLEGANLGEAHLDGTTLSGAWLDSKTVLSDAMLDKQTKFGDIQWSGVGAVNLTQITWNTVPTLGDEVDVNRRSSVLSYEQVVRAYRQLAAQLRAEGMSEVADRFAYRAQVLQRRVLRRRRRWGAAFGSWLLDLISGHGYKPVRSLITYVLIICAFAGAYLLNAQFTAPYLTWDEALVLSVSSFHGRGFFTSGIALSDTLARLAAGEAIMGLLIEITFIATFTQRFFGAK
jgi:hypothetical protein